jgi:hypothetical protein
LRLFHPARRPAIVRTQRRALIKTEGSSPPPALCIAGFLIARRGRLDELVDRMVRKQPLLVRFEIDLARRTRRDPVWSRVNVAPQLRVLSGRLVCDGGHKDRDQEAEVGDEEHQASLQGHDGRSALFVNVSAFLLNDDSWRPQQGIVATAGERFGASEMSGTELTLFTC